MVSGERLKTALVGASIALILIASALTDRTISALIAAQDWVDHTQSVIDHIDPTLTAMTESAFNGSKMRRIGALMGREGRITLRARLTPSGEIAMSIADNGIGMSPEVMANAAQAFYQADQTAARAHDGTGLGLFIVQGLMKLHGGSLALESTIGVGTTATLTFPRERARPGERARLGLAHPRVGEPMTEPPRFVAGLPSTVFAASARRMLACSRSRAMRVMIRLPHAVNDSLDSRRDWSLAQYVTGPR
jgi:hypothetical protein